MSTLAPAPFSFVDTFASVLTLESEESVSSANKSLEELLAERRTVPGILEDDDDVRDCSRVVRVVERYRQSLASAAALAQRLEDARATAASVTEDADALVENFQKFVTKCTRLGCTAEFETLQREFEKTVRDTASTVGARVLADSARHESDMRKHENISACIREALVEGFKLFNKTDAPAAREFAHELTCPICFERPVSKCFAQCGHTICQTCESRLVAQVLRCPVCRVAGPTVRLFLLAE